MMGEWMLRSPLLVFPLFALFFFLAWFALIITRTFRRKASSYDALARLPLEERSPS